MEAYHMANGFNEIAQHFTTYPDGKICVCRDLGKDGAGISKQNTGGVVVENIDDFDAEQMTQKQREAIIRMSALLCKKLNIPMQINADRSTMTGGVYSTDTKQGIKYHAWYTANEGKYLGDSGRGNNGAKTCLGKLFFGGTRIDTCKLAFIPAIQAWMQDYPDVPTGHWAYKFISSISFTDVPATHPAYWFINVTISMGVMGGYVDFTFRPEDEITRAEMAVVINNLLRLLDKSHNSYSDTSGAGQRYVDVPATHWGFRHIEITSRVGVMGATAVTSSGPAS